MCPCDHLFLVSTNYIVILIIQYKIGVEKETTMLSMDILEQWTFILNIKDEPFFIEQPFYAVSSN